MFFWHVYFSHEHQFKLCYTLCTLSTYLCVWSPQTLSWIHKQCIFSFTHVEVEKINLPLWFRCDKANTHTFFLIYLILFPWTKKNWENPSKIEQWKCKHREQVKAGKRDKLSGQVWIQPEFYLCMSNAESMKM